MDREPPSSVSIKRQQLGPHQAEWKMFQYSLPDKAESTLACSDNSQIDHKNILSHWRPKSLEPAGIR